MRFLRSTRSRGHSARSSISGNANAGRPRAAANPCPRARRTASSAQCAGYYRELAFEATWSKPGSLNRRPSLAQRVVVFAKPFPDLLHLASRDSRCAVHLYGNTLERARNCCQWILLINQSANHSPGAKRSGRMSARSSGRTILYCRTISTSRSAIMGGRPPSCPQARQCGIPRDN